MHEEDVENFGYQRSAYQLKAKKEKDLNIIKATSIMWHIHRQVCSQHASDERFVAGLCVTLIRPHLESHVQF